MPVQVVSLEKALAAGPPRALVLVLRRVYQITNSSGNLFNTRRVFELP
jgi:hypothetical protein